MKQLLSGEYHLQLSTNEKNCWGPCTQSYTTLQPINQPSPHNEKQMGGRILSGEAFGWQPDNTQCLASLERICGGQSVTLLLSALSSPCCWVGIFLSFPLWAVTDSTCYIRPLHHIYSKETAHRGGGRGHHGGEFKALLWQEIGICSIYRVKSQVESDDL